MSFGMYMVGFIVLVIGLAIGAYMLHVPQMWIGIGLLIAVGIGIMMGVTSTRTKDSN
jgi:hypothetical protein